MTGCAAPRANLPAGQSAYEVIPARAPNSPRPEYEISVQDKLTITVYQEPELSVTEAPVEVGGGIVMPLVGRVQAAGLTSVEFANALQQKLGNYLVDPRVSVIIVSSRSQRVTVDGAVNQAGVYEMEGETTLLETVAMARGASRTAAIERVAIFRNIDGQRHGALFDLAAIRAGQAPDPAIEGGDYVIVGNSAIRAAWQDFLTTAPVFAVFVPLAL
ncbi:polysaccharide biosynthesis/export family protein [Sphingosinithalassobacter sp. LHW66-3]|uniref:polysaccharide biosynthesis/export family protein n=1 Tax=Sphingosinithalassobacter sp. LHW66-3 TaxID=3424718 RepID=UPI003D6B8ED9